MREKSVEFLFRARFLKKKKKFKDKTRRVLCFFLVVQEVCKKIVSSSDALELHTLKREAKQRNELYIQCISKGQKIEPKMMSNNFHFLLLLSSSLLLFSTTPMMMCLAFSSSSASSHRFHPSEDELSRVRSAKFISCPG